MILHGKNLIVSAGGSVLGASKSCSLSVQAETIKVSSPDDGLWEHVRAGRCSWDVTTNHLLQAGGYDGVIKATAVAHDGNTTPGPSSVTVGGKTYRTFDRGLNLIRLSLTAPYEAVTGTYLSYDTYGETEDEAEENMDRMEEFLENRDDDGLWAIVSYDAFGMNNYLADTIQRKLHVDMSRIPRKRMRGALTVIGGTLVGIGMMRYAEPSVSDIGTGSGTRSDSLLYMRNGSNVAYAPLRDAVKRVGQVFDLQMSVDGLPCDTLSGKAVCKSFKVTATKGNLMQGSFQWEGTGPLV
ncbi:MAG: hypothetical protein J1E37_06055 [Prevotella sp.]|nr:hypothetical protein [Prevotella sp.]